MIYNDLELVLHSDMGSSRNVYLYEEDKVLKIPRNIVGSIQNKNEVSVFEAESNIDSKYLKFLCPCGIDNEVLIMDKVSTVEIDDYLGTLSYPDGTIYDYIDYADKNNIPLGTTKEDIEELVDYLESTYKLYAPDIKWVLSWGVQDGKLKLYDYGTDISTYDRYYADGSIYEL